jgi:hypothetical protein
MLVKLGFVVSAFSLVACQSVANLDVKYNDAGSPTKTATTPPAGRVLADGGTPLKGTVAIIPDAGLVDPTTQGQEADPCPCDSSQGLACCVSTAGPPICTTNQDQCNSEQGSFFRCFGPDPSSESVCCLHRHGATTETALAGGCAEGAVVVCTEDADCPNSGKCSISTCPGGVKIGACDANPVCPQ